MLINMFLSVHHVLISLSVQIQQKNVLFQELQHTFAHSLSVPIYSMYLHAVLTRFGEFE